MNKDFPYYYSFGDSKLVNYGFPTYKQFRGITKMEQKEWKKTEDLIFKFEKEGDSVEGKLISKEKGHNYDNEVYKLEKEGKINVVFSTTVMESQMQSVNIGDQVKIVFVGTKESKQKGYNDIKLFDIFTK